MNQEKIAKLIKKIRKDNNLTQKELANKLNVTFQAVSKWETGKSTPDVDTLKRISDLYNIDINDLLSGVSTKKKRTWFYLVIVILAIIAFGFIISTCKTGKNTTLEQYLKEVNIILDDINDVCKDHNEMELELKTNNEGVNRVYNLPLELNTCSGEK